MKKIEYPDTWNMDYDFPAMVVVEPTNSCNLHCSICPQKDLKRKPQMLDMKLYNKIVLEVAEHPNTILWPALMGEPLLLRDKIIKMVESAKKSGIKNVSLNTNGMLLSYDVFSKLHNVGLDKIIIGVDAFTEDTYNKIRCGGDFSEVDYNIKSAILLKEYKEWKNPEIVLQFIVSEKNKHEEKYFIKYWTEHGATVKVRRALEWGKNGVKMSELRNAKVKRFPCPWIMRTISIHSNGNIIQCDADWGGNYPVGNIKNMTIQQAWNKLKKRRDEQVRGIFKGDMCEDCHDWKCGLSQWYYPKGDK